MLGNLIGVSQDEIIRGEVLTIPGWLKPTEAMDVHLRVIPDAPHALRHNMEVTVHTGSSEGDARFPGFQRFGINVMLATSTIDSITAILNEASPDQSPR